MIDFEGMKKRINIVDLVGSSLKRIASTGGGELAGPCPFCGGNDRFRVQPENNIWLCRHCTNGKWRDVVDYIAMRDGISIGEAARVLSGDPTFPSLPDRSGKVKSKPKYYSYNPPSQDWQAAARQAVNHCQDVLFGPEGAAALNYLHKRGFTNETIKHFQLGFSTGLTIGDLWIPHGITIPCHANGVLWYLKIRTNTKPKYILVKGSKPAAIFNADDLAAAKIALLVEGEFNAVAAWQATREGPGDRVAIASMGAAGYKPNFAQWGIYFINKTLILALFDDDDAGEKGAAAMCLSLGERCKLTALPKGSGDLNDFFLAGGDIAEWLKMNIEYWRE